MSCRAVWRWEILESKLQGWPGVLVWCARMSEITNDSITKSGIGCVIAVPIWQQWASKG